jgi:hypothetical protein
MRCDRVHELIGPFVEGELGGADRKAVAQATSRLAPTALRAWSTFSPWARRSLRSDARPRRRHLPCVFRARSPARRGMRNGGRSASCFGAYRPELFAKSACSPPPARSRSC